MRRPRGASPPPPADPGLVPSGKVPHPDAPTAPRTADTGATTATTSAQAEQVTKPSDPVGSYIASLMSQQAMTRPGLAGRLGPLPVQWQNPVGGYPLSGGQVFLRSLVSGFNQQASPMAGMGGKGANLSALVQLARLRQAAQGKPVDPLEQQLMEARIASEKARGGAFGALAERRNRPPESDPLLPLRQGYLQAEIEAAKALAGARNRANRNAGGAGGAGGAGRGGAKSPTYTQLRAAITARGGQLAKQRDGAVQQIGAARGWSKEQIAAGRARMKADVASQVQDALRALDQQFGVTAPEAGMPPERVNPQAADPLGIR